MGSEELKYQEFAAELTRRLENQNIILTEVKIINGIKGSVCLGATIYYSINGQRFRTTEEVVKGQQMEENLKKLLKEITRRLEIKHTIKI